MRVKEIVVTGRLGRFMRGRHWAAVTLPLWPVVILYWCTFDEHTRRHEHVHVAQIQRMGRVKFTVVYLWHHFTKGYWANPLEEEAYRDDR